MMRKVLLMSVLLVVATVANADLLQNGGFESGSGSVASDWTGTGTARAGRSSAVVRTGTEALRLNPDPAYNSGSYAWASVKQSIDVSGVNIEGDTVMLSAYGYTPSSDPLSGWVLVYLKMLLYNASNSIVASGQTTAMSNNSPRDAWISKSVSVVAPAGVDHVNVELQLLYKYDGRPLGGEVYFDDVSTNLVPEPATLGLLAMGSVFGFIRRRRK